MELINLLISSGIIVGVVEAIHYRRENKKIKESEAKNADTEAQEKQMDLAELYLQKVLKLTETGNATVGAVSKS